MESRLLVLIAAVCGAIAIVQTLRLAWRRIASSMRLRRGLRGEREAEALLRSRGYRVRGRQVRAFLDYAIDGAPHRVEVRADYVVERDGRTFVAEVKTGRDAPRLETATTRRQLLEYAHAFGGSGVLLVDADRRRVAEIALPIKNKPRAAREIALIGIGAAFGVVVAWLLRNS